MSVDLIATMLRPITMAAVIDQARWNLSDLLGLTTVPDLVVCVDRQYEQGVRTDPGRCLDAAELGVTVIGEPIAPDETGVSGSIHFEIDVPATGDGIHLMVIDLRHAVFGVHQDRREAVVSPDRTCVGVAVATGVAMAVAFLAAGEYIDDEIRMLAPPVRDPSQVIGRTRLREPGSDFAAQCEKYLRQFPDLDGWPQDRSMTPARAAIRWEPRGRPRQART